MKEFPIIFSASMVRAILEGRKTQTRRIVKPQPSHDQYHVWRGKVTRDAEHRMWCWKDLVLDNIWDLPQGDDRKELAAHCPYGVPGDRLWVRETWNAGNAALPSGYGIVFDEPPRKGMKIAYRADAANDLYIPPLPWRPSIFMPRWASRITLEIAEVRVQRVQEISEEDCRAEGIDTSVVNPSPRGVAPIYPKQYGSAKDCFRDLWDSINAKRGFPWDSNPWVWAISFKRV